MSANSNLSADHQAALSWFSDRAGQKVAWPARLNGMFLVNKAKGITSPAAPSSHLAFGSRSTVPMKTRFM